MSNTQDIIKIIQAANDGTLLQLIKDEKMFKVLEDLVDFSKDISERVGV